MKRTRSIDFCFIRYGWQRKMNAAEFFSFVCLFRGSLAHLFLLPLSLLYTECCSQDVNDLRGTIKHITILILSHTLHDNSIFLWELIQYGTWIEITIIIQSSNKNGKECCHFYPCQ
jgi:hypothetical protein